MRQGLTKPLMAAWYASRREPVWGGRPVTRAASRNLCRILALVDAEYAATAAGNNGTIPVVRFPERSEDDASVRGRLGGQRLPAGRALRRRLLARRLPGVRHRRQRVLYGSPDEFLHSRFDDLPGDRPSVRPVESRLPA